MERIEVNLETGVTTVHEDYIPEPVTPPTPEQIREGMSQLSARQLRLALLSIDLHEADIDMLLVNDAAGMVEWKYASYYRRLHPLVVQLGAAKGLNPVEIDSMWMWASEL